MRYILAFVTLLGSPSAIALDLGIGAAAWPDPALSVRYGQGETTAWHVTGRYGERTFAMTGDMQRVFTPSFGRGRDYRLGFYTGLGLAGESREDHPTGEAYHVRFPLGLQLRAESLHLEAFLEAAGLVGEIPRTQLGSAYSSGLRATF